MADDAIVVTTETKQGRLNHRILNGMFGVVGLSSIVAAFWFWLAPAKEFTRAPSTAERILLAIMCIGVAILCLVLLRFAVVRGTWRLDDAGVVFTPLRGPAQAISWREIEAILLEWHRISFCARRRKVRLVLQWETPERHEMVTNLLREKLGGAFDAFERQPAKTSLGRILRASAIGAVAVFLSMGGLLLASFCSPGARPPAWASALAVLPLAGLYVWALVIGWRQRAAMWSVRRPEWRATEP
jgi:hypothetical protein